MVFRVLLLSLLLLLASYTKGQELEKEKAPKNQFFGELGGPGGLYSVNYGRTLFSRGDFRINASIGFSVMPVYLYDTYSAYPVMPISIGVLYGKNKHYAKFGITNSVYMAYVYKQSDGNEFQNGAVITRPEYDTEIHNSLFILLGYQYEFNERLYANMFFSPAIYDNEVKFMFWGGVGIGFNF